MGEQGAEAAGRAGAFTSKADDPSAVEYNPAGLAKQRGTTVYFGNRFANIDEQFTRAPTMDWGKTNTDDSPYRLSGTPPYVEFATVKNAKSWQLFDPMLIVASDLGLKNWGFALGAYAPPGISSAKYPIGGGQRYMMTERDVKILYYTASAAWKYNDIFGIGATLQWIDLARLKFNLVVNGNLFNGDSANPVSSIFDIATTMKGADHFTLTSIIGAWYKPKPFLELAISGRVIPVTMKADCNIQPRALDLDSEITVSRNSENTLSLPMPASFRLGTRYISLAKDKEVFDIELDIGMEAWSIVDKFQLDANNLQFTLKKYGKSVIVDRLAMDKKWKNSFNFHLGGQIAIVPDRLIIRSGAFYETPAADDAYANVDFYNSHQIGGSAGLSVRFLKAEIAMAYTYVYLLPVTVSEGDAKVYQQVPGSPCKPPYTDPYLCDEHYLGQPAPAVNAGNYQAQYHFLTVTGTYKF